MMKKKFLFARQHSIKENFAPIAFLVASINPLKFSDDESVIDTNFPSIDASTSVVLVQFRRITWDKIEWDNLISILLMHFYRLTRPMRSTTGLEQITFSVVLAIESLIELIELDLLINELLTEVVSKRILRFPQSVEAWSKKILTLLVLPLNVNNLDHLKKIAHFIAVTHVKRSKNRPVVDESIREKWHSQFRGTITSRKE